MTERPARAPGTRLPSIYKENAVVSNAVSSDAPFEVVFVCTGNRARSALAEALFRYYAAGVEIGVSSVGTLPLGPMPPLPDAAEAGRRLEVDLSEHRARSIDQVDLRSADLVVGFEPGHVAAAVVEGGAPPDRTFLLGELVTLLDLQTSEKDHRARARLVVADAGSRRTRTRARPGVRIVHDPFGRSSKAMQETAEEIDRLIRQLVAGLFGLDVPTAGSTGVLRRLVGRRRPSGSQ
jgi:protein-tyrosine phosphatase